MATSLESLRTRVRCRANMERSQFCSDAEINQYINDSYQDLYDRLVAKFEDYYVASPLTFTVASGENTYDLPADFFKLLGIDRAVNEGSDEWYPLKPFNFHDRNVKRLNHRRFGVMPNLDYRIIGGELFFVPEDLAPGSYRLWYVPLATLMADDSDTIAVQNGWEEFVVIDATIKCLVKQEDDVSALELAKAQIVKRIDETAMNRDIGEVQTIQDVSSGYGDDPLFYY